VALGPDTGTSERVNDPFPVSVSVAAIRYRPLSELRYSVATFNVTYGLTDDLDLNLALPIATHPTPGRPRLSRSATGGSRFVPAVSNEAA
jgi:hypothetical protein